MNNEEKKTPLIYERISKVMEDLSAVGKNQINQQQRFNFRGIDDVYNAVHSAMARHQVFTTSTILEASEKEITSGRGGKGTHIKAKYEYTFYTVDGSCVTTITMGEGVDYGDKGYNKCASISHKYALIQIFCIPTEDMAEPDKEVHEIKYEPINKQQPPQQQPHPSDLKKKIEQMADAFKGVGVVVEQLTKYLNIESIGQIQPQQLKALSNLYQLIKKGEAEPSQIFKPNTIKDHMKEQLASEAETIALRNECLTLLGTASMIKEDALSQKTALSVNDFKKKIELAKTNDELNGMKKILVEVLADKEGDENENTHA